jgi:hypothetical protein
MGERTSFEETTWMRNTSEMERLKGVRLLIWYDA